MGFHLSQHIDCNLEKRLPLPYKKRYANGLNLSSNEINHSTATSLFQEFLAFVPDSSASRYPYWPTFVEAIATYYQIDPSWVNLAPGADEAIRVTLGMLGKKTGQLILQCPNYIAYELYATLFGLSITPFTCLLTSTLDEHIGAITSLLSSMPPAIVVITNPHGFTGQLLPLDAVKSLAQACWVCNQVLVIDETYSEFCAVDHLEILSQHENVVLIRSFSKSFGMAGLRFACMIAQPALTTYLARWRSANPVSVLAGDFFLFCLHHQEKLKGMYADIHQSKIWVREQLTMHFPNWRCELTATNFLLIDTGNAEMASEIVRQLARRAIFVKSLQDEPEMKNCFRISIGEKALMSNFLTTLEDVCSKIETMS